MFVNAEPKQFKLSESGEILFQPDASNPLPGQGVARLRKGPALLSPELELLDTAPPLEGQDATAAMEKLTAWLAAHIAAVLEPLKLLETEEGVTAPAREIALKLHESLGIVPRDQIAGLIEKLDQEDRRVLRQLKVRLGPVLVFLPALNKPASVRMRALLWSLWHDRSLPALVPADGMTSLSIVGKEIDPEFFRTIGYPAYGPRAIRVDMLDRVIGAVYDNAKSGQFKARHEMAEWMGCSIPDLYAVLEAMGHKKISDPADQPATVPAAVPVEEKPAEEPAVEAAPAAPAEKPVIATDKPPAGDKPELATFRLRQARPAQRKFERPPQKQKSEKPRPEYGHKKHDKKKESRPARERTPMSAAPKTRPEDSPFAVLQQLKARDREQGQG